MTIDFNFTRIKGPEDSKRANFHELCNLLIMREYPHAKPVEGSEGFGDWGADTFIGQFGGEVWIFQHKYFCHRLGKTQTDDIRESLKTAVTRHKLRKWTLCLPKNLNPKEQRWFEGIKAKNPDIEIDHWGKTALRGLLLKEDNLDLVELFFGSPQLKLSLFRRQVDSEINSKIGRKYIPELYVDRPVQELFDWFLLSPQQLQDFLKKLRDCLIQVRKNAFSSRAPSKVSERMFEVIRTLFRGKTDLLFWIDRGIAESKKRDVKKYLSELKQKIEPSFFNSAEIFKILESSTGNWSHEDALQVLRDLKEALKSYRKELDELLEFMEGLYERVSGEKRLKPRIVMPSELREDLRRWSAAESVYFESRNNKSVFGSRGDLELDPCWDHPHLMPEGPIREQLYDSQSLIDVLEVMLGQSILIIDTAGSGKTNLLCQLAKHKVPGNDQFALFLAAKACSSEDIGHSLLISLDLASKFVTFRQFVRTLENFLILRNKVCLIVIDGINENSDTRKFNDSIATFLNQFKESKRIKVVLSCRDVYYRERFSFLEEEMVTDCLALNYSLAELSVSEKKKAMDIYTKHYGISCEFSEEAKHELQDLLLLRFFCEAYASVTPCDVVNLGKINILRKRRLFQDYLNRKARSIQNRYGKAQVRDFLEKQLKLLAEAMLECGMRDLSKEQVLALFGENKVPLSFANTLYMQILDEDIILQPIVRDGDEIVLFTYESFKEFIIAKYVVDLLEANRVEFESKIAELSQGQVTNSFGILLFLFLILKEELDINLWEFKPKNSLVDKACLEGIANLDENSIDKKVLSFLQGKLETLPAEEKYRVAQIIFEMTSFGDPDLNSGILEIISYFKKQHYDFDSEVDDLVQRGTNSAIDFLCLMLESKDNRVANEAIAGLVYPIHKDKEDILDRIRNKQLSSDLEEKMHVVNQLRRSVEIDEDQIMRKGESPLGLSALEKMERQYRRGLITDTEKLLREIEIWHGINTRGYLKVDLELWKKVVRDSTQPYRMRQFAAMLISNNTSAVEELLDLLDTDLGWTILKLIILSKDSVLMVKTINRILDLIERQLSNPEPYLAGFLADLAGKGTEKLIFWLEPFIKSNNPEAWASAAMAIPIFAHRGDWSRIEPYILKWYTEPNLAWKLRGNVVRQAVPKEARLSLLDTLRKSKKISKRSCLAIKELVLDKKRLDAALYPLSFASSENVFDQLLDKIKTLSMRQKRRS